jgi:hypothetical protein
MSPRTIEVSPSTHLGVAMGGHTSRPKYENSCVLSNACGKCRMGVAATWTRAMRGGERARDMAPLAGFQVCNGR